MRLNELADRPGSRHAPKRVGRGIGSGRGKTSTRGQKGQKSRSGVAIKGFEGGQMPIHMRLPKRGFNNPRARHFAEVNIGRLQVAIDAGKIDPGQPINAQVLLDARVIRRRLDGVRLLAKGVIKAAVTIEVRGVSQAARKAVEQAGGTVVIAGKAAAEAAVAEAAPTGGDQS